MGVLQYIFESSPSPQSLTFPKSLPGNIVLGVSKINWFDQLNVVNSSYFYQFCLSWGEKKWSCMWPVKHSVCPHDQRFIELLMRFEQSTKLPLRWAPNTLFQAWSLNSKKMLTSNAPRILALDHNWCAGWPSQDGSALHDQD